MHRAADRVTDVVQLSASLAAHPALRAHMLSTADGQAFMQKLDGHAHSAKQLLQLKFVKLP